MTASIIAGEWEVRQQLVIDFAKEQYEWAVKNGIAKECARVVLPEGLTKSKMYVNGTLRSWIHYLDTRLDKSTQKEHREVALSCKNELIKYFPELNDIFSDAS